MKHPSDPRADLLLSAIGSLSEELIAQAMPASSPSETQTTPPPLRPLLIAAIASALVLSLTLGALYHAFPGLFSPNTSDPIRQIIESELLSHPLTLQKNGLPGILAPSDGAQYEPAPLPDDQRNGIAVHAKLLHIHPDIFTPISAVDRKEYGSFRLLLLETVEVLSGGEMTRYFYMMLPEKFSSSIPIGTDLVLGCVTQLTYERTVIYNEDQSCAQALTLPLFLFPTLHDYRAGAYKEDGKPLPVWNQSLIKRPGNTLESAIQSMKDEWGATPTSVRLLYTNPDTTDRVKAALKQIEPFSDRIYIESMSRPTEYVIDTASLGIFTRYLNGYPTSEVVRITPENAIRLGQDLGTVDPSVLPDLSAAKRAILSTSPRPPHAKDYGRAYAPEAFLWYARCGDEIVGILRLQWKLIYDISPYPSQVDDALPPRISADGSFKSLSGQALARKLGDATYIYTGAYNSYGKTA